MPETKILIVEDEAIVAEDIHNSLQSLGYIISAVVSSGKEAITKIEGNRPDLVLMDIVLKGDMDGIEAASQINSRFNIPVVYLTAFTDEKTLERAKLTEPFGYIVKPFEDRELHSTVEMALYKHKIESRLKESESWLSTILRSIGDAVVVADVEGNIQFMNDVACSLTGWKREEGIGKTLAGIFNIVNEETRKKVEDPVTKVIRKGKVVGLANHTLLISKDGTEIPIDDSGAPVRDEKGNIIGIVLVFHDIIERKKAEEKLKKSEKRYRSLYEYALSGLYRSRISDGKILLANKVAADMLGYESVEELMKEFKFSEAYSLERRQELLRTLEQQGSASDLEIRVTRKDGKKVDLIISARIYPEDGYIEGAMIDITDKKRLESQVQQARQMESIGTLAGGIAHDFNNLLMGIQGYTSLMLNDLDPGDDHYNKLKSIEKQVKSGAELSAQLLGFARGGKYDVKPTDINKLLKKSAEMFGRTKKEITIREKYASDLWIVEVDRGQIEQVLLNLFVNAWQAMPDAGDIYLETSNVVFSRSHAKPHEVKSGEYVRISVTDTGIGMDEETASRVFDPFFTTKGVERGTGLGLASAYGIVKNHGGMINVYSELGYGSTFNIYLPAVDAKVEQILFYDEEEVKHGREEVILLVDDEKVILDVGEELLNALGYKVFLASGGNEAIEIYKENKDKINLVILDMVMPGMGGGETYKVLKSINPDIKAMLSSGYNISGEAAEIMKHGVNDFIQKPFTMTKLSHKIRNILEKK
ncbi:MAG: response regulator [Desulfobacteraceae bacterium]|nr:response regulator [Pseudomonadota bacterium]MCG2759406.1 response regulator [Desulfobacteraceae bacterium]